MRTLFLSKGSADQTSGGYLYNRYLVEHLRAAGLEVEYCSAASALPRCAPTDVVIVDSLAIADGAARLLSSPAMLVLLLHVLPDWREIGPDGASVLVALYRRSRIVVTGDSTLSALRDCLGKANSDVVKIEPGVPRSWRTKHGYSDRATRLLGVANYIRGKGVARLLDVLQTLRHLPWTLRVHGNSAFDPFYFRCMRRRIRDYGLTDRVALLGPVAHEAINDEMQSSDLLVHFSQRESYSMVTAEAIACGLPVLSYRTGNAGEFARSGLVRYLDDASDEADALGKLIEDSGTYARLRRVGTRDTRTWQDVGSDFVSLLGST